MAYTPHLRYGGELYHYRTKGSKNGVRRYQNLDGSLTAAGYARYGVDPNFFKNAGRQVSNAANNVRNWATGNPARKRAEDASFNYFKKYVDESNGNPASETARNEANNAQMAKKLAELSMNTNAYNAAKSYNDEAKRRLKASDEAKRLSNQVRREQRQDTRQAYNESLKADREYNRTLPGMVNKAGEKSINWMAKRVNDAKNTAEKVSEATAEPRKRAGEWIQNRVNDAKTAVNKAGSAAKDTIDSAAKNIRNATTAYDTEKKAKDANKNYYIKAYKEKNSTNVEDTSKRNAANARNNHNLADYYRDSAGNRSIFDLKGRREDMQKAMEADERGRQLQKAADDDKRLSNQVKREQRQDTHQAYNEALKADREYKEAYSKSAKGRVENVGNWLKDRANEVGETAKKAADAASKSWVTNPAEFVKEATKVANKAGEKAGEAAKNVKEWATGGNKARDEARINRGKSKDELNGLGDDGGYLQGIRAKTLNKYGYTGKEVREGAQRAADKSRVLDKKARDAQNKHDRSLAGIIENAAGAAKGYTKNMRKAISEHGDGGWLKEAKPKNIKDWFTGESYKRSADTKQRIADEGDELGRKSREFWKGLNGIKEQNYLKEQYGPIKKQAKILNEQYENAPRQKLKKAGEDIKDVANKAGKAISEGASNATKEAAKVANKAGKAVDDARKNAADFVGNLFGRKKKKK